MVVYHSQARPLKSPDAERAVWDRGGVGGNTRIRAMWLEAPRFPTASAQDTLLPDEFTAIRQKGAESEIGRRMSHGELSLLPQGDILGSPTSVGLSRGSPPSALLCGLTRTVH